MIHSISVVNYLGERLDSVLDTPSDSGFCVFNISGIGPGKADIRVVELATGSGGIYNSSHSPSRNIVLSLRFFEIPGKTVENLRHETYKYFPIGSKVTLTIVTDTRTCSIEGYVEANEPVIFSKETYTQISIICPDPLFFSGGINDTHVTVFSGVYPSFSFPFANSDPSAAMIEFGEAVTKREELVSYTGDATVGVVITIEATGTVEDLTIYHVTARKKMILDTAKLQQLTGSVIIDGDKITISTIRGARSITLLRDGVEINLLNILGRYPEWFALVKGDNIFAFDAAVGNADLMFKIENRILFEGV